MKVKIFFFLLISVFLASCESDSCLQSDWVGNYTLENSVCDDPIVNLAGTLSIEAGDAENVIVVQGFDATLNGCIAIGPFETTYTLDGTNIEVDGFGCTGKYVKI